MTPRALFLLLAACGGGEAIPPPVVPPLDTTAPPPPPPPAPDPTCKDATAQKHAKADGICKAECSASNAESCLIVGRAEMVNSNTDGPARALPFYSKACDSGSEEGCSRASEAVRSTNPAESARLAEAGCKGDPATDFGVKNCYAAASVRASSGKLEELQAVLPVFVKLCRKNHQPSCAAKSRAEGAIKEATAPIEYEGAMVSKVGAVVRIKLKGGAMPAAGTSAEMHRYFESKPGEASPLGALGGLLGGGLKGWVGIASTKIDKVDKDVVVATVIEERSTITINGKKVNHFSPGARVKLAVPQVQATAKRIPPAQPEQP